MSDIKEDDVPFLPMTVDYLTQVHRVDGSLYRLYLLREQQGPTALRISSASPLTLELIPENESAADLGFIRFLRKGDLDEEWEIDSIQTNNTRPDNDRVRDLFISCWTAASASSEYKKSDWKALRRALEDVGYEL